MEHPNFITEDYGIDTRILADGTCDALFGVFWDYTSLREQMGDDIGAAQLPTVNINGQPRQMKAPMRIPSSCAGSSTAPLWQQHP